MDTSGTGRSTPELLSEIERLQKRVGELEAEKAADTSRVTSSNEQNFKALVENTPDIISRFDREMRHTYVNPAVERATSISASAFIGKTHSELGMPTEIILEWSAAHRQVYATKQPVLIEYDFPSPEGVRYYQSRLVPEFGPGGQVEAILNIARDITELKLVEQQLRNSRDHFEKIFRRTPIPIGITDLQTRHRLEVNDAFLNLTGYTREELLGSEAKADIWPDKEQYNRSFELMADYGVIHSQETKIRDKQGRIHFGLLSAEIIRLDDEECVLTMFMDLTERKEAEKQLSITEENLRKSQEQLLQARKLESIGRLAGGIAHDFNNLLTAISGYSDLMLLSLEEDNPLYADVQEILKATDRAAQLTHQLLAFSRQQVLQPVVLNLNTIVIDISRMLHRLIGENIELIVGLEEDLKPVLADPSQFEQVILNLTVNARDAMRGGGKLLIETNNVELNEGYSQNEQFHIKPGNYVRLAISDNGTGMDAATQSHIFEPFFTTKEQGKGTGLGLATVYGIVKQSGGYIWVYSEPGVGTTFKIFLPATEVDGTPISPVPQVMSTNLRGTETVLLVEDEGMVRNLANRALTENGYKVLVASNGTEALDLLEEYTGPLDLILTDVIMPKMGGSDLIKKMAGLRPGLKVVFISGYTDWAVEHHGLLQPGQAFLQKPFTTSHLIRKVRQALEN